MEAISYLCTFSTLCTRIRFLLQENETLLERSHTIYIILLLKKGNRSTIETTTARDEATGRNNDKNNNYDDSNSGNKNIINCSSDIVDGKNQL